MYFIPDKTMTLLHLKSSLYLPSQHDKELDNTIYYIYT